MQEAVEHVVAVEGMGSSEKAILPGYVSQEVLADLYVQLSVKSDST